MEQKTIYQVAVSGFYLNTLSNVVKSDCCIFLQQSEMKNTQLPIPNSPPLPYTKLMPRPKRSKSKNTRLTSYFYLTINTIVWGAALIVVKPAFDVTTPFRFLLYRYAFAVLLSLPLLFYYLPKIKNKLKTIGIITILELIGTTLALALLYFGLEQTSAIEASLLATTTPIFVTVAGILILKERQEKHETIGLTLAFGGTILLTLIPILQHGNGIAGISLFGNIMIIGHNLATALYLILAKKHYRKLPKLFITTISFYVGLFSFLILSLFELYQTTLSNNPITNFSNPSISQAISNQASTFTTQISTTLIPTLTNIIPTIQADLSHLSVWTASLYMALFGSIIGLTAYIKGQENIEASEASLFWYLQPLVYIPLGVLLLKEQVSILQIIFLAIILLGVVFAEKRRR